MAQIVWTTRAKNDLRAIENYFETNFPEKYIRLLDKMDRKLILLLRFPEMGRIVPGAGNSNNREIILDRYRIIYEVLDGEICIKQIHNSLREKLFLE